MSRIIISLTEKQAATVEEMCNNELQYKLYESGCSHDYNVEINALLLLMKTLNPERHEIYKQDYKTKKVEDRKNSWY